MPANDLARAVAAGDPGALPEDALAAWVTAQRWFSSKLREVHEFRVLDLVPLRSADPVVAIAIAEARFGSGRHEVYQVPIAVRPRGARSSWRPRAGRRARRARRRRPARRRRCRRRRWR